MIDQALEQRLLDAGWMVVKQSPGYIKLNPILEPDIDCGIFEEDLDDKTFIEIRAKTPITRCGKETENGFEEIPSVSAELFFLMVDVYRQLKNEA